MATPSQPPPLLLQLPDGSTAALSGPFMVGRGRGCSASVPDAALSREQLLLTPVMVGEQQQQAVNVTNLGKNVLVVQFQQQGSGQWTTSPTHLHPGQEQQLGPGSRLFLPGREATTTLTLVRSNSSVRNGSSSSGDVGGNSGGRSGRGEIKGSTGSGSGSGSGGKCGGIKRSSQGPVSPQDVLQDDESPSKHRRMSPPQDPTQQQQQQQQQQSRQYSQQQQQSRQYSQQQQQRWQNSRQQGSQATSRQQQQQQATQGQQRQQRHQEQQDADLSLQLLLLEQEGGGADTEGLQQLLQQQADALAAYSSHQQQPQQQQQSLQQFLPQQLQQMLPQSLQQQMHQMTPELLEQQLQQLPPQFMQQLFAALGVGGVATTGLPSQEADAYWIVCAPSDGQRQQHTGKAEGKWMLFYKKHLLDAAWEKAVQLFHAGQLVGVHSMKVSTARPNAHAKDKSTGVIILYCGSEADEAGTVAVGRTILEKMEYRGTTGTTTFPTIYWKSDRQTLEGQYAGSGGRASRFSVCLKDTPAPSAAAPSAAPAAATAGARAQSQGRRTQSAAAAAAAAAAEKRASGGAAGAAAGGGGGGSPPAAATAQHDTASAAAHGVTCYCSLTAVKRVSQTKRNPGRHFWVCPKDRKDSSRCEFFQWMD